MIPKKYCSLAFVLYKFLLVELDPDLSYYIPLEKRKFGCRWEPALDIFHESRTFCGANLSLNEFDHPEENRTYLKGYPPN